MLALGDSYTVGEGVSLSNGWPAQLVRRLRERERSLPNPLIVARTGWTTDELISAIDQVHPQGPFALVSLLIGVNDQYRGRSAAEYRPRFQSLLEQAVGFAGTRPERVLVLSIPDWGVTPFAADRDRARIAIEIDRFNAINHAETERVGACYLDITPISRRLPDAVAADGLHPSANQYAQWVDFMFPVVLAMLADSPE